jgi:hypothetical protein
VFFVWSFILWGVLIGIYAAVRPRYGPGPKTALCVGSSVWGLGYLLTSAKCLSVFGLKLNGAPGMIRTCDLWVRRQPAFRNSLITKQIFW